MPDPDPTTVIVQAHGVRVAIWHEPDRTWPDHYTARVAVRGIDSHARGGAGVAVHTPLPPEEDADR